jgi:hypothetical protein
MQTSVAVIIPNSGKRKMGNNDVTGNGNNSVTQKNPVTMTQ